MGIEMSSLSQFFMHFAVMSGVAALAFFLLCPLFNKMVKEL
jgi:hypothetical protein